MSAFIIEATNKGKLGCFAFPVEKFQYGSTKTTADTVVTGLYFCAVLLDGKFKNGSFYMDDIPLMVDYKTAICESNRGGIVDFSRSKYRHPFWVPVFFCSFCSVTFAKLLQSAIFYYMISLNEHVA